jgi:hypothetical protein
MIPAIEPSSRLRCLMHETRLRYMHEPPTLLRISQRLSASFYAISQPWTFRSVYPFVGMSLTLLAYTLFHLPLMIPD